ncbi:MAG: crotonase/enoyl-CoA hydratase family protein [Gammaproteobacteria bacterium]|nr:crotonase/enoyl-CoA hydratase family protein [Gammaproteobacteria bacterium]
MNALVSYQLNESVATITMDDGKVNAMSPDMQTELNAALDQAVEDKAVVVLIGREGIFSGGFDLPTLKEGGEKALQMLIGGFELSERILKFPTPVIIANPGHCVAMGVFIMLSADYRIGIEGPFKMGANEVAIGLVVPESAIEICRNQLTPACFNRSVLTAEFFQPKDALQAGFLDKLVEQEELLEVAQRLASEYVKLDNRAYQATKAKVRGGLYKKVRAGIENDAVFLRKFLNL